MYPPNNVQGSCDGVMRGYVRTLPYQGITMKVGIRTIMGLHPAPHLYLRGSGGKAQGQIFAEHA